MRNEQPLLPTEEVVVGDAGAVTASVIWLHGLGASGDDFVPIVPELALPAEPGIRFVFPHAPELPVTVNGGMVMPAWYDILEMQIERRVDMNQLLDSAARVRQLIDREVRRGIPSQRIVLAGFSQGGAVAYHCALTHPAPLAGLLAMSTYLATARELTPNPANASLPIAIQHGQFDPVVPESLGQAAAADLQARGYQPHYRVYPMEHQVCGAQIADISALLQVWLQADG